MAFLLISSSHGQNLHGKVLDQKGESAPFATVSIRKSSDSTLAKVTLTDVEGKYILEGIKAGNYRISVTMIGYKAASSGIITVNLSKDTIHVPTIILREDAQILGEVQIVVKKPMIVQEAGKTVVNVENSIVASGGLMASDVLKRTPGVVMDNEGNISLKGKTNVLLLLDGKPTYLNSKQAYAILKSIPSNQIASIEIITAPSAKYDAQGNAGVINIIMKKGFALGWNGNLHTSLGQGYLPKSNFGGNLSWGGKRFSFNSLYDFIANQDFNQFYNDRNFGLVADGERLVMNQHYFIPSMSHTFRINADWEVNNKLKLGTTGRLLYTTDRWIGNTNTTISDNNGNTIQTLHVSDSNPNYLTDMAGGLNGTYKFDTLGHKISADVDISDYNQQAFQQSTTQIETTSLPSAPVSYNFYAQLPTRVDIFMAKTDYSKPISKKLLFEGGLKYVQIHVLSNINYSFGAGMPTSSFLTGGTFHYAETNAAAYVNLSYTHDRFSLQGGLRVEKWDVRGNMVQKNIVVKRDSLFFFPSALAKFKINDQHEIGFSFSSRIDRPNYRTLNPIAYYGDPYDYYVGNPKLKPQFTNHFELSHTAFEGALVTTLNYTQTRQYISEYAAQQASDSSQIQYVGPANLPKFENYGASVSLYLPIKTFWTCQAFVNVYQNRISGEYLNTYLNSSQFSAQFNTTQSFLLPNNWSVEASGLYISPTLSGYSVNRVMGMLSLGVQKGLFNNFATVKLALQDAFYTFIYRGSTEAVGISSHYSYQWDNRVVTLTFTYKFGLKNLIAGNQQEDGGGTPLKSGGR